MNGKWVVLRWDLESENETDSSAEESDNGSDDDEHLVHLVPRAGLEFQNHSTSTCLLLEKKEATIFTKFRFFG